MMFRSMIRVLFVGAALCAGCASALADRGGGDHDDRDRVRQGTLSGEFVPLADLLKTVAAAHPGQVVETELEEDDGVVYYDIYVLQSDGRVVEVEIDARTGMILKAKEDD